MPSGINMIDVSRGPLAITGTSSDGYKQSSHLFGSRNHEPRARCHYITRKLYLNLDVKLEKNYTGAGKIKSRWRYPTYAAQFEFVGIENNSNFSENGVLNDEELMDCSEQSFEQQPIIQNIGDDQPSMAYEGALGPTEGRLFYLEERDEGVLSKRLLNLSRLNKVRSGLGLYKAMQYSGLRPNVHSLNSLLSCLLRNGMLDDALRVFDFMKGTEIITGHTCSIVLKAVADSWGSDAALRMFEELESNGNLKKHFDVIVYNTMISAFSKMNLWVQTEKIWRVMQDSGHAGTSITYRLLICLFVRCGQNELALDAYHEMVQNGVEPNDDAMHAIIGACAKEGKWDLALNVFQSMLHSELKPNLVACNAVISSLGKAGKANHAFKVHGLMKALGHEPDAYTWNALLIALYRANRHSDALLLFERIKKNRSFKLNLHIYNTALMSCKRLGLWDKALQLLWQIEASGLSVSNASYNLVIGACEVARKPEVALQVYGHMVHQNRSPDTFTLLSLIRSCIWGSRWEEVEEILNGFAPNGSLYNAAIQGLCLRGKRVLARKLYRKMLKNDLKPDGKTRAMMLQNLKQKSAQNR